MEAGGDMNGVLVFLLAAFLFVVGLGIVMLLLLAVVEMIS
jgi:hypothetical protein